MPATQHDAVLWLSGSAYDVIFDTARSAIAALRGIGSVAEETSSWPYRHDLDLTGFIDGTENPTLSRRPELVLIPEGEPGAGGTVLLLQKWEHDAAAWESLAVEHQERVIGRTKRDSVELDDKPADSHVASTDQDRFGKIFRRNMPYGTVTDARDDVRRLQPRAAAAPGDAREHGRAARRAARRADEVHEAADRRVLLRPVGDGARPRGCPDLSGRRHADPHEPVAHDNAVGGDVAQSYAIDDPARARVDPEHRAVA